MATTTYTYDVEVDNGNNELASGTLTVNINNSTTPPTLTGSFTPTGGTAVTCDILTWDTGPNGVVNWKFTLTKANGDFPIKQNGGSFTYHFTGNENASGNDPGGQVNWPNPNPEAEFEETVTWQSEATQPVEESQARGQGAN
jgi:hypothetical protein